MSAYQSNRQAGSLVVFIVVGVVLVLALGGGLYLARQRGFQVATAPQEQTAESDQQGGNNSDTPQDTPDQTTSTTPTTTPDTSRPSDQNNTTDQQQPSQGTTPTNQPSTTTENVPSTGPSADQAGTDELPSTGPAETLALAGLGTSALTYIGFAYKRSRTALRTAIRSRL